MVVLKTAPLTAFFDSPKFFLKFFEVKTYIDYGNVDKNFHIAKGHGNRSEKIRDKEKICVCCRVDLILVRVRQRHLISGEVVVEDELHRVDHGQGQY